MAKCKVGYLKVGDYLRGRVNELAKQCEKEKNKTKIIDLNREKKYVMDLLHDQEYLEVCGKAVENIQQGLYGLKIIKEELS